MVKKLFLIIILLVCLIGFYCWNKNPKVLPVEQQVQQEKPLIVEVGRTEAIPFVLTEDYIGYVSAIKAVEVHPYIAGFIDQVFINGGQVVKKGDILFLLEQGQYLADMELKKANVAQAVATFENADTYFKRMQEVTENTVSQADFDKAKADFFQSAANLVSAIAAYKSSKIMYDYTFIKAPIDGVVGNISITEGQYVSPSNPVLAYIIQPTPIRVVFSVPNETFLNAVIKNPNNPFVNKKIRLKLANGNVYEQVGEVEFSDNQVNNQTSSIQVWANFENPNNLLLQNAYVDVMVNQEIERAILIPQKIVEMDPDGNFVWIVNKDGILEKQKIFVAQNTIDSAFYFVVSGLSEGDFVILDDSKSSLKEGQKVQIKLIPMEKPSTYTPLSKENK